MGRTFLTNKRIVGVTMAFREGDVLRYCLDKLLEICDDVFVLFDNGNDDTMAILCEYQKKFPNFHFKLSSLEWTINKEKMGDAKRRLEKKQGLLRDDVLREVRKMHDLKPVDLLLFPDGDEVFVKNIGEIIEKFWVSDKKVLFLKSVTPYDSLKIIRERSIVPHAKIFKYVPNISAIPYRGRNFYNPYTRAEATRIYGLGYIHLALLSQKIRDMRRFYAGCNPDTDDNLWYLDKDVTDMTAQEILKIKSKPPEDRISDYLIKKWQTV